MRVSFHPAALAEVEAAQGWYEERSILAASGFLQELMRAIQRAADAPRRYRLSVAGTRRVQFDRYPYALVYRAGADEVLVIAIAHAKRRPDYWRDR